MDLEVVAQTELHASRSSQQGASYSNVSSGKAGANGGGVEADRVCDVVYLPGKLHPSEIPEFPALGEAGIQVEVAIPPEVVAFAGLARIGEADGRTCRHSIVNRIRIGEELRIAVGVEVPVHLHRRGHNTLAAICPIRCVARFEKGER